MREFTAYARRRMQERGIEDEDVYSVLANRVSIDRPGRIPASTIVRGLDKQGRLLDVVISDMGEILNAFYV